MKIDAGEHIWNYDCACAVEVTRSRRGTDCLADPGCKDPLQHSPLPHCAQCHDVLRPIQLRPNGTRLGMSVTRLTVSRSVNSSCHYLGQTSTSHCWWTEKKNCLTESCSWFLGSLLTNRQFALNRKVWYCHVRLRTLHYKWRHFYIRRYPIWQKAWLFGRFPGFTLLSFW